MTHTRKDRPKWPTGYIQLDDWDTFSTERRRILLDQGYTLNDPDMKRLRGRIEKDTAEYLALIKGDSHLLA